MAATITQTLTTFFKKKGFIYPSSEIYGGVAGLYDYGHMGTLLKKNFENAWRNYFLKLSDNFFEIETAQIMHENVFKASGHIDNFIDPVVKCSKCAFYERADHFIARMANERVEGLSPEELTASIQKHKLACPECKGKLLPVIVMNMMFPIQMGISSSQRAFLRPETAQSPYVNFKLQYESQRKKLPLGLALIGKAFRNEISPRNLTLRQREFTQAELQIFFNPQMINSHPHFDSIKENRLRTLLVTDRQKGEVVERTAAELVRLGLPRFYVYHLAKIQQFYSEIMRVPLAKFRLYELTAQEKAFYNKFHFDIEIELQEHGFTEVGGLHYRTDHDLAGHQRVSKQSMEVVDEATSIRFIPHVLEVSFGVDRNVYALLDLNYEENAERGNVVLHLPAPFTPFTCAVFPLVKNNSELAALAEQVYEMLKVRFVSFYDETASIGRRYARADEIGVRFCVTADFDSLLDKRVTIRDRETTKQERVAISELTRKLTELLA